MSTQRSDARLAITTGALCALSVCVAVFTADAGTKAPALVEPHRSALVLPPDSPQDRGQDRGQDWSQDWSQDWASDSVASWQSAQLWVEHHGRPLLAEGLRLFRRAAGWTTPESPPTTVAQEAAKDSIDSVPAS